jgi:hypothetical protein
MASFQPGSTPAYSEEQDAFGVEKIYQTAADGNEWYVNMDNPTSDPNFRNLGNIDFDRNPDGSWRVSADKIRMEAWLPSDEKWLNVEITEYAEWLQRALAVVFARGSPHVKRRVFGQRVQGKTIWRRRIGLEQGNHPPGLYGQPRRNARLQSH